LTFSRTVLLVKLRQWHQRENRYWVRNIDTNLMELVSSVAFCSYPVKALSNGQNAIGEFKFKTIHSYNRQTLINWNLFFIWLRS